MPHICPWWGGYFIDNPIRHLLHNPEKIVGPYVKPGMTVMDVGCGMGFFSIAMARMVGDNGQVIAVDLQQQMLDVLRKRAEKANVAERIQTHACDAGRLGVKVSIDLALAFAMVHEVSDAKRLLAEIHSCLKPGGKFFVAEPRIHVPGLAFAAMVATANDVGLQVTDQPRVRWCRAVVFRKV
jgi:ubiquinone/menaquinone biosynthesis C-methylase UbiE